VTVHDNPPRVSDVTDPAAEEPNEVPVIVIETPPAVDCNAGRIELSVAPEIVKVLEIEVCPELVTAMLPLATMVLGIVTMA